jgi:hypothetical protein
MKDFFNYIAARIEARVPAIKKVDLWNNQFIKSNTDRKHKAFPYPICFVEFIINQTNNYSQGFKDYFMTVRFRFGVEGYKFQRLETFDFCDDFHAAIYLMRPTDVSGLYFTSFQEVNTEFDEDHNQVEVPHTDYRTRYRSTVAHNPSEVLAPPTALETTIEFE